MVEIRRGSDAYGTAGGERLPWLEPVEDEDGLDYGPGNEGGGGYGGVLIATIAVLIGIAAITAAVVWWRHHLAATADLGQIIHAPQGEYKVRPADPGGMKPDANGQVTYGTSTGQDIDSPLDLSAMPEQPIERAAPTPAPATPAAKPATGAAPVASAPAPKPVVPPPPVVAKPAPAPAPAKPVEPVANEPVPTGASGTIQLGAFSTQAKALSVWKTMSARFAYLKPLEQSVVPVESDGKTLYRLRASGPGAPGACARLRIAGETCSSVG